MTFLPNSLSPDARFPRLARFPALCRWASRLLDVDLDLVRKLNAEGSALGKPAAVVISRRTDAQRAILDSNDVSDGIGRTNRSVLSG